MSYQTAPCLFRTTDRAHACLHTVTILVVLHPWMTDKLAIVPGSFGGKLCIARIPLAPFLYDQGQVRAIQLQRQFSEIFLVPQITKAQSL